MQMMLKFLRIFGIIAFFSLRGSDAISVDWTSYSDQADLPMSTEWRSQMKAKLLRIEQSTLTPEQKIQY